MTVRVTRPEIDIAEKIRELDKPSGVAGELLLRADTTREQQNILGVGRRNIIINGDFRISQRGDYTSNTAVTNDTIYIDRWLYRGSGVTATTRHDVGNNTNWGYPHKSSNSLVLTATSSGTGIMRHLQRAEGWFSGLPITFSAWVRSNSPKARLFMYQHGGNPAYRVSSQPHSGGGEWEYLSFTAVNDSTAANQNYFDIAIAEADFSNTYIASGDFIEISQVQAEIGTSATPFEQRMIGEEMALCQRYFEKAVNLGVNPSTLGSQVAYTMIGAAFTSTAVRATVEFKVTKRTDPSITRVPSGSLGNIAGTWGWYNGSWNAGATSLAQVNTNGFSIDVTVSGAIRYQAYLIDGNWYASAEF